MPPKAAVGSQLLFPVSRGVTDSHDWEIWERAQVRLRAPGSVGRREIPPPAAEAALSGGRGDPMGRFAIRSRKPTETSWFHARKKGKSTMGGQ